MILRLLRIEAYPTHTMGLLLVDGLWVAYTLEDPVRLAGVKIPGATAIPTGEYAVRLTMSPKFGRVLPELIGVPLFEGIRIHPGNDAIDTAGCVLLGLGRDRDHVWASRAACQQVQDRIAAAIARGGQVVCRVEMACEEPLSGLVLVPVPTPPPLSV